MSKTNDLDRLCVRLREFGGWRLVWQYARMGVLWKGCVQLVGCVLRGQSVKAVYPAMLDRIETTLLAQYGSNVDEALLQFPLVFEEEASEKKPKVVWSCWLQGEDAAPELVQVCWQSVRRQLPNYELRIVTLSNYRQWAELPSYVIEKYRRGILPAAHLSDLLRLELLVRHGGTWMDSTVLCTGFPSDRLQRQWAIIEASPLALFRYFPRGSVKPTGLSNWFISARQNHAVLVATRNAMQAYWRDYDCTVDYYLMHLFLATALERQTLALAAMPRLNSRNAMLLGSAFDRDYTPTAWQDLTDHVAFHKLNYRKTAEALRNDRSYCSFILGKLR